MIVVNDGCIIGVNNCYHYHSILLAEFECIHNTRVYCYY